MQYLQNLQTSKSNSTTGKNGTSNLHPTITTLTGLHNLSDSSLSPEQLTATLKNLELLVNAGQLDRQEVVAFLETQVQQAQRNDAIKQAQNNNILPSPSKKSKTKKSKLRSNNTSLELDPSTLNSNLLNGLANSTTTAASATAGNPSQNPLANLNLSTDNLTNLMEIINQLTQSPDTMSTLNKLDVELFQLIQIISGGIPSDTSIQTAAISAIMGNNNYLSILTALAANAGGANTGGNSGSQQLVDLSALSALSGANLSMLSQTNLQQLENQTNGTISNLNPTSSTNSTKKSRKKKNAASNLNSLSQTNSSLLSPATNNTNSLPNTMSQNADPAVLSSMNADLNTLLALQNLNAAGINLANLGPNEILNLQNSGLLGQLNLENLNSMIEQQKILSHGNNLTAEAGVSSSNEMTQNQKLEESLASHPVPLSALNQKSEAEIESEKKVDDSSSNKKEEEKDKSKRGKKKKEGTEDEDFDIRNPGGKKRKNTVKKGAKSILEEELEEWVWGSKILSIGL